MKQRTILKHRKSAFDPRYQKPSLHPYKTAGHNMALKMSTYVVGVSKWM
jgi:hypothetical protein